MLSYTTPQKGVVPTEQPLLLLIVPGSESTEVISLWAIFIEPEARAIITHVINRLYPLKLAVFCIIIASLERVLVLHGET
jgi:hypothetical protein